MERGRAFSAKVAIDYRPLTEAYKLSDQEILALLFDQRYGNPTYCPHIKCGQQRLFYPSRTRNQFCCSNGHNLNPLSDTVLIGSQTSLAKWFVTFRMYGATGKISAADVKRKLGVTYKTAWRMVQLVKINETLLNKSAPSGS